MVTKGSDGTERHKTFKIATPHQETHVVCTNRGPSFTKGDEDPSEVKAALVDRSNFHQVRKEGTRTHDDAEFERNVNRPEVAKKMRAFRILTCLTGLLRMLIFRQNYLQPDLSFAQRLFDEWDKELDEKYGLPKLSPRKNIKRLENLTTMCCLNAVGHVFFYKQTSCMTRAGKVDEENPHGLPFKIEMLYECVQLLQPTREMIHRAWTMGLEYNIGTSSMGTTAMTVVAETVGMQVGSFFRIPTNDYSAHAKQRGEMTTIVQSVNVRKQQQEAGRASSSQVPADWHAPDPTRCDLDNFEYYFNNNGSVVSEKDIATSRNRDRARREARIAFQLRCSKTASISQKMNVKSLVEDSMLAKALTLPLTSASDDEEGFRVRGALLHEQNMDLIDIRNEPQQVQKAYHEARSVCFPGCKNCPFKCNGEDAQKTCPYCVADLVGEDDDSHKGPLSLSASLLWPTLLDGALFYKTQTLVQMAADSIAQVQPGCGALGTRRFGEPFSYKQKNIGNTGAARMDIGWVHASGEQWTSWNKVADHVSKKGNPTVSRFDIHRECLRDTMYMLSSSDNARRCPEEPRLANYLRAENALQSTDEKPTQEDSTFVQLAPYLVNSNRKDSTTCKTHKARKRSAASGISTGPFQRRFDSMVQGGRLSALNFMVSPRVSTVAPLRMHHDGLEVNIGGLYNHVSLVAELIKALASVPGLKNMQERFSNSRQGPEGLSATRSLIIEKGITLRNILCDDMEPVETVETVETSSSAPAAAPGPSEEPSEEPSADALSKRGRQVEATEGHLHTLPYSYDIVPMGISLDMLRKLYDDKGKEVVNAWGSTFTRLGKTVGFADLPQFSTSFVGYEEHNRQTISLKLESERPLDQVKVKAGDPDMSTLKVNRTHISRSIGRKASDADVEQWVSRRQGARSTGMLDGDLFAYSTWVDHTYQSARKRGFVCTVHDPIFQSYSDMEHMLRTRALELACEKNDKAFGSKYGVDFDLVKLQCAEPSTYEAMAKSDLANTGDIKKKIARVNRPRLVFNGGSDGAVGRMPKTTSLFEDEKNQRAEMNAMIKAAELANNGSSSRMEIDGEDGEDGENGPLGGTLHIGPRPM